MKIEANKSYKTRGGAKAYILATNLELNGGYSVVGVCDKQAHNWGAGGKFVLNDRGTCDLDIISEWEEPLKVRTPEKLTFWDCEADNVSKVNHLIDYCQSLQSQIDELKKLTVVQKEYGE